MYRNNKIKMFDFQKMEFRDDFNELINNLKELINKEIQIKYLFVSFDEDFWLYYINYYQEDVKKLKIIENTISSYLK